MFEKFSNWHGSGIDPVEQLKSDVSQHLHALEEKLNRCFPDILNEEKLICPETLLLLNFNFGFLCNGHTQKSLKITTSFVSTYLCERGFSTLVQIKTKARNKLDVQDHMRLAVSRTQPRIKKLYAELQTHPFH